MIKTVSYDNTLSESHLVVEKRNLENSRNLDLKVQLMQFRDVMSKLNKITIFPSRVSLS